MPDILSNVVEHPFDEKGVLPENNIINEQRDLPSRDVRAVRPRGGAFFIDTFKMRDANGVTVDPSKYQFALFSDVISRKLNRTICGVVLLTDKTVVQPVYIDYRCVGGPWGVSNEVIIEMFYKVQQDNRPVDWGNILNLPDGFTPAHHFQDIGDLYGAEYWVAALDRFSQAVLMGDKASHDEILRRITENNGAIDDKFRALETSIKAYVDAQDLKITQRIDVLEQSMNVKFAAVNQRVTDLEASTALALQQMSTSIANVNTALGNHVRAEGNVHNLTAAALDVYTRAEVDRKLTESGQDLSKYVLKDSPENLSIGFHGNQLDVFKDGAWITIWPPQWQ